MAKLDGTKVMVIGGASGVGFAVAAAAMQGGAEVVVGSSQAGRIEAAAKKLGIPRSSLYNKIKQYGISREGTGTSGTSLH